MTDEVSFSFCRDAVSTGGIFMPKSAKHHEDSDRLQDLRCSLTGRSVDETSSLPEDPTYGGKGLIPKGWSRLEGGSMGDFLYDRL